MNMKKNILAHPDILIGVFALIFLGILLSFYSWATGAIVAELHEAVIAPAPQAATGFDLQDASKLDLRGLVSQPTP